MNGMKIFEFTYVEYPADSGVFGLLMVLVSFLPHIAPIVTCTIAVSNHSWHHFYFLLGLILSHEFAKFLKRVCAQPRPKGAVLTSYGMPSDHSQFMFFIAMYVISHLWTRRELRGRSFVVSYTVILGVCLIVGYSRLYLGVHTVEQVVVGAVVGIVGGRVWYLFTKKYLLPSKRLANWIGCVLNAVEALFCAKRKKQK